MTDRNSFPSAYPLVELAPGQGTVGVVTYRRTDTIQVKITIHNPNGTATVGQLRFENADYWEGILPIPLADHFESVTVPANGTKVVTVTLSGMPNYVSAGLLLADVSIDPTTGAALEDGLAEWIFLVDATPVGLQAIPWLEVLTDGCVWASGDTGAIAVSSILTTGLFSSSVMAYSGGGNPTYCKVTADKVLFKLKRFFDDRNSSGTVFGECRDVSGYLHLLFSSQGIDSELAWVLSDQEKEMYTNQICPIGGDAASLGSYSPWHWNFHQILRRASNVYDACAAHWFDLDGALFKQPPHNWSLTGYWQTSNPNWQGGAYRYFGLVDGWYEPPAHPAVALSMISVPIRMEGIE